MLIAKKKAKQKMSDNHDQFPAQTHMPDFIQKFDGSQPEVTSEDQTYVAKKFESFFDDTMLERIEDVHDANGNNPEWPRNRLSMRIANPDGQSGWVAQYVQQPLQDREDHDIPAHQLPPKFIELAYVDSAGNVRDHFIYGLGSDNVVRRHDSGDIWGDQQDAEAAGLAEQRVALPRNASDEVIDHTFSELEKAAQQGRENQKFELDMGQNDQPIGSDELDGVVALLSSPNAVPGAFLKLV
jgi:hypothetical protein